MIYAISCTLLNITDKFYINENTQLLIEDNEFVEGEDYLMSEVRQQVNKHGGNNKKAYMMKPKTFKLCLMRSKNCKQYAKYYFF